MAMILKAEQELSISGKTVLKLMREEGLRCRIRRKRYSSYRGERGKIAKNFLNRDFAAEGPTTKLVTDVTEFKVAGAKAHLSAVMDLYNNEIMAWSVTKSANFVQTMETLDDLSGLLKGPALLHSDSKNVPSRFCGIHNEAVSCKPGPRRSILTRTPIDGQSVSAA